MVLCVSPQWPKFMSLVIFFCSYLLFVFLILGLLPNAGTLVLECLGFWLAMFLVVVAACDVPNEIFTEFGAFIIY